MNTRRFVLTSFLSWLLFLSLDFVAHASILRSYWAKDWPAIKSQKDLFRLIPSGYLSFLILTLIVGWLYVSFFKGKGSPVGGLTFGAVCGGLYALYQFLGWYSFLNLPVFFLFLICLVYFIELAAVGFCFGYLMFADSKKVKKKSWILAAVIFAIFLLGIFLQNI